MNQRGALTSFLLCKLGIVFAVAALIGSATAMSASFDRAAQREELGEVAERVTDALEEIDGTPGKVWIERDLPAVGRDFDLVVVGSYGRTQFVRVRVGGDIERSTFLSTAVNGGNFALSCRNPTKIRLTKEGQICLEVI